jgi:hypothetical protein
VSVSPLDYTSLDSLSYHLGKRFWADIEAHHPGIDRLWLPVDVADGWRTVTDDDDEDDQGTERRQDAHGDAVDQLPVVPHPGASLLPGPGALGGGGPGPLGAVGRGHVRSGRRRSIAARRNAT